MPVPEPQAILTPLTEAAIFLTVTIEPDGEDTVRDLLGDVSGLRRSVGFRIPEGELTCVVGIGDSAWKRLFGLPRPAGLHPFREIRGARHSAPATSGDLLFHIRARRLDLCFELAQRLIERLRGTGQVVDEVHGFRSFDERDMLGFVDGTENPDGGEAREAALIGDEDLAFAGGSYVIVQKYLHDLSSWDGLGVAEQERIIGRTKLSDLEFPDELKASNSHVALNTIVDDDGNEHKIMRFNMPFGRVGVGEFGTYFIGYSHSTEVIERMLSNMFNGDPEGNYDRILDFSTAVTGSLFFVPSIEFLDDPPGPGAVAAGGVTASPQSDEPGRPEDPPAPSADAPVASLEGSLGIGSMREAGR